MLTAALSCAAGACASDTPAATGGRYCETVGAHLAELNTPAIVDSTGITATADLYRSITSIAPLAVQKEWQTMTANVETAATVNAGDPASVQRVADAARASQHAATAIADYTSKVCGLTIGTPTTPAPTVPPTASAGTTAP